MRIASTLVLLFSLLFKLHAQEELVTLDIDLKTNSYGEVYSSVSSDDSKSCLVFKKKDSLFVYEFNQSFDTILRLDYRVPFVAGKIQRLFYSNGQPTILIANNSIKKFHVVSFNMNEKSNRFYEFEISQKNGTYLGSIATENKFYIINIIKQSSDLWFYELSSKEKMQETLLSGQNLYFDLNTPNLHYAIKTDGYNILDGDLPVQLSDTMNKVKFYSLGDNILLTIDYSRRSTITNIFDPVNQTVEVKNFFFDRSKFRDDRASLSNSYAYKNFLVQTLISNDVGLLHLTDIQDGKLKYSISFSDDKPQNWNSNLRKVNNRDGKSLKPSKYLKRSMAGVLSASAYQYDNLVIEMGSRQEGTSTTGMAVAAGVLGGAIGGIIVGAAMNSEYDYVLSVTLDDQMNKIDVSNSNDLFNRLSDFNKRLENEYKGNIPTKLRHVFRVNDHFIYGYYKSKENKYVLLKFPLLSN